MLRKLLRLKRHMISNNSERSFHIFILKTIKDATMHSSYCLKTAYGMCETFIQAVTTLGTTPADEEAALDAKLYPKLNSEVIYI